MVVKELMSRDVVSVTPDMSLKDVAATLVRNGISGAPVCDADGAVLGVVSEADILVKEAGPRTRRRSLTWLVANREPDVEKAAARSAGEAMTAPAITIGLRASVHDAARVMVERGVNRLPVLDRGKLVGILTRADLVRAFRRTDAEIECEIREDVIEHTAWIPPWDLEVDVKNGEVRLGGEVERHSDAKLIERFAKRVPGVVALTSELRRRHDDLSRVEQRRLAKTL